MKNAVFIFSLTSILMCGLKASAIGLNEPVPAFEAIDDEGNVWKSTDHIGKKMVVVGFSKRGTKTTDTYSLFGFTQAYETILKHSRCK